VPSLDLAACAPLQFEQPDLVTFRCLALAFQALRAGGDAPAVLNAANEEAVSAFLQGRIGFLTIPTLVANALSTLPTEPADTLEVLLSADQRARQLTLNAIAAT
jgi:1-deoxy-D-xylulose-5-phosphate reductoisomerase